MDVIVQPSCDDVFFMSFSGFPILLTLLFKFPNPEFY